MSPDIVICAKSEWAPAIRREHAFARAAARTGLRIQFVERASDVRSMRSLGFTRFVRLGVGSGDRRQPIPGISVISRSTLVPGHRGRVPLAVDSSGLAATLARSARASGPPHAVVVNTPWDWPAVGRNRRTRRVVDLADDWCVLMPAQARLIKKMYARMDAEADAIVVASEQLRGLFAREVTVVPNGVGAEMLSTPLTRAPRRRHMVYVGTLSERFDVTLIDAVLTLLPQWRLDLHGPCHYRGQGSQPSDALHQLLASRPDQVRWHGALPRDEVSSTLDTADVLVLPNDVAMSVGQDSMKLYDYAARGRPIVTTAIPSSNADLPGVIVAPDAAGFAAGVRAAGVQPRLLAADRRRWAESHTWDRRLGAWLDAVVGQTAVTGTRDVATGHRP